MTIVADTHVHFRPGFDPEVFLDAALSHADRAVTPGERPAVLLCLTDTAGEQGAARLGQALAASRRWRCAEAPDGSGHMATRNEDGRTVLLLPGRQVISTENLEALALNCREDIPDRRFSAMALIEHIRGLGATPVLPWAFGKWSGRRGNVMREVIHSSAWLILGDNGNRPRGFPEPALLAEGRRAGRLILAGSDPLPLPGEERRAGCCGVVIEGNPGASSPREAFMALMSAPEQWRAYGTYRGLVSFVAATLRMQRQKRG